MVFDPERLDPADPRHVRNVEAAHVERAIARTQHKLQSEQAERDPEMRKHWEGKLERQRVQLGHLCR